MTIISAPDTRNSTWSQNPSSYGRKMLEKMGWKGDASGLGKNQQGTTTNLRAVRRSESLGIGAETDALGIRLGTGRVRITPVFWPIYKRNTAVITLLLVRRKIRNVNDVKRNKPKRKLPRRMKAAKIMRGEEEVVCGWRRIKYRRDMHVKCVMLRI